MPHVTPVRTPRGVLYHALPVTASYTLCGRPATSFVIGDTVTCARCITLGGAR